MNRRTFVLVMLIPLVTILALISYNYYTLSFGEEILLKTAPIDPWDIFRGDYVRLNYEISTIDLIKTPYDRNFTYNENAYAVLSKGEKFWYVKNVGHDKPALKEGEVCIRGRVLTPSANRLSVSYGIESYFVPEGKGRVIEREIRDVSVKVAVDTSCGAIIKELYINDEPVRLALKTPDRTGPPVLTSIAISPSIETVTAGDAKYFSAITRDQYGNPIRASVEWSSSNKSVGTIDSSGRFRALTAGVTTITAISGNITGNRMLTVQPAPPATVTRTMVSLSKGNIIVTLTPSPATLFDTPGYQVIETIPREFTFIETNAYYTNESNIYTFTMIGGRTPIIYNLMTPLSRGRYAIYGSFRDEKGKTGIVSGTVVISVGE